MELELDKHETVPERSEYAGIGARFVASLLDGLILGIPAYIFTYVLTATLMLGNSDIMLMMETDPEYLSDQEVFTFIISMFKTVAIVGSITFIVYFLYYTLMESSKWQGTLGKKIMNVQVAKAEGGRISFGRAAGRFLAKSFLSPILMIGYIMAFFTERRQALHDMLAGTIVVKK
ncbi:RDD family protein [Bacillus licheniformis]|uniref:RDD family protein n=1 Tax=Bacillus licheniformis TaxID=1402 RepID=UPI0022825FF8|nr:RDD family protein [Bacillus licheniformis]MCY8021919.1 RDD family protein [Bacillus licheniformis]